MLRRTFMKLVGLFGGLAATATLSSNAEAKAPELSECPCCKHRNRQYLSPQQAVYAADTEDDLWDQMECWFAGHRDVHDQVVMGAKKRVLERHQSVLTAGEPEPLLRRQEQLTYT